MRAEVNMKKSITSVVLLMLVSIMSVAQNRIFYTGINPVRLFADGKPVSGDWWVSPELKPDVFETTASEIVFASDKDTLVIDNLKEWGTFDFVMITNEGDSAYVRVNRKAVNPFENPNPELLKMDNSGKLSRKQAVFDIDGLIYGLSQVHPDIFSVCKQEDLLRAVNQAKASLADSVTRMQLYRVTAPIVAMIGDGHTHLNFPYNSVFTKELKRFPVYVNVRTDRSIICTASLDSMIARGDRILSVNNISADSIINAMIPFVSGERPHFRIARIDAMFAALFQMLYAADDYEVKYQPKGTKKVLSHTFPATAWDEIKKRTPSTKAGKEYDKYSYTVDSVNNVAVMDFREFHDVKRMEQFADSMFTDLTNRNISNLIIDIRDNGGGHSGVGDVLLRYISPEPFVQIDKVLVRITPLTAKLIGQAGVEPTFIFQETDTTEFIRPRSIQDGHYAGNVYLLTSNRTFSSAGSFAWTFKECGMGKVIGEETGGMNVCYGEILQYALPVSKLTASISFKRFWQLRADENNIHGTIPDVNVPAADALDVAMKLVKKNKRKR